MKENLLEEDRDQLEVSSYSLEYLFEAIFFFEYQIDLFQVNKFVCLMTHLHDLGGPQVSNLLLQDPKRVKRLSVGLVNKNISDFLKIIFCSENDLKFHKIVNRELLDSLAQTCFESAISSTHEILVDNFLGLLVDVLTHYSQKPSSLSTKNLETIPEDKNKNSSLVDFVFFREENLKNMIAQLLNSKHRLSLISFLKIVNDILEGDKNREKFLGAVKGFYGQIFENLESEKNEFKKVTNSQGSQVPRLGLLPIAELDLFIQIVRLKDIGEEKSVFQIFGNLLVKNDFNCLEML